MASKKTSVRTPTKKRGHPQTNPKSLANLAPPFPKGVSGNPGGRPKLLGDSYKAMLARVNESDPQGRTNAELIANAALIAALGGDVSAMREIRSATEGDKVELTNREGLTIRIEYADTDPEAPPADASSAKPETTETEANAHGGHGQTAQATPETSGVH